MDSCVLSIPIKFHPRAISAFGDELVTNDNIVIAEIVKNSYDAFATHVDISIKTDADGHQYLEILDDGIGMNVRDIQETYAVVATPNKDSFPTISRVINGKMMTRNVSGNKGVGRFSASKLGKHISIFSKTKEMKKNILAVLDWNKIERSQNLSDCVIILNENPSEDFFQGEKSGTLVRIENLQEVWDSQKIANLDNELSRLLNPFKKNNDFIIRRTVEDTSDLFDIQSQISVESFINYPVYTIKGCVDEQGSIIWEYEHVLRSHSVNENGHELWFDDGDLGQYCCGPFSFEIRAWNLDADSVGEISEKFGVKRGDIRKTIASYKGLSVYRDDVLVLPKSTSTKDWLGLDARRISKVGDKISTSQIVGMVNISSQDNPGLTDTTNREGLVDSLEYRQFCKVILDVVKILQMKRHNEKQASQKPGTLEDSLSSRDSEKLVDDVQRAIEENRGDAVVLSLVKHYHEDNEKKMTELSKKLTYYAQVASLGSVSIVLMHEFLTGMTVIKRFLSRIREKILLNDKKTEEYLDDAEKGHKRISELVNSFSPLCMKDLHKKKLDCDLKSGVANAISIICSKKISQGVVFENKLPETFRISLSEGELQTIVINLLDNACYWMKSSNEKKVSISLEENDGVVQMIIADTGVGVKQEDVEKIFLPGVTSKLNGLGMGLVIVTEMLSYYNCKVGVRLPSDTIGATFVVDLPIVR